MNKIRISYCIAVMRHIQYNVMWNMITIVTDGQQTMQELKGEISHTIKEVGGKYEANDNDNIYMLITANKPDICDRFYVLVDQILDETGLERNYYGATFAPEALDYLYGKLEGFIIETPHSETFTTIEFDEGAFEMLENIMTIA